MCNPVIFVLLTDSIYRMKVRKLVKTTGKAAFGIVEFFLLYAIAGTFMSFVPVNNNTVHNNDVSIYILSNGVHTDLVVPIKNQEIDWNHFVRFDHTTGKDSIANFVAFGWGDKGFYLDTPAWSELKVSTAFKAAFALSEAAIHTTFYREMTEGEKCVKINVSREQYRLLVDYIKNSFDTDKNNQFIHISTTANYGENDTFYEAKGTYNLFYTCNTWANNGLKSCQQKASLWTLLDRGIFYQYEQR